MHVTKPASTLLLGVSLLAACLRAGYDNVVPAVDAGVVSNLPDHDASGGSGGSGSSMSGAAGQAGQRAGGAGRTGQAGANAGGSGPGQAGQGAGAGPCIPSDCDDGIACTVESCDAQAQCSSLPDDATCDSGQRCLPSCFAGCGTPPSALALACPSDEVENARGSMTCELQLTGGDGALERCLSCSASPQTGIQASAFVPVGNGRYSVQLSHVDALAHAFSLGCAWNSDALGSDPLSLAFGEVVYSADFTSGPGTNYTSVGTGTWSEGPGTMRRTSSCSFTGYPINVLTAGAGLWTDATIQARVRIDSFCNTSSRPQAGLALRASASTCSTGSYLTCLIDAEAGDLAIAGYDRSCGSFRLSGAAAVPGGIALGTDYTMTLSVTGSSARCVLSGGGLASNVVAGPATTTVTSAGSIGFVVGPSIAEFDDVIVTLP